MLAVAAAATDSERAGQNIKSPRKGCAKQARLTFFLSVFDFFDEQIFVCRNSLHARLEVWGSVLPLVNRR